MYDLGDTLGAWMAAFARHEEDCPFVLWAQNRLGEPVTVVAQAPPEIVLVAPLRALGDMRPLFDRETAAWFADLVARNTTSRAIARWARGRVDV